MSIYPLNFALIARRFSVSLAIILMLIVAVGSGINTAQAITISPVRLEITGDRGTTVHGEFMIVNDQPSDTTYYASFENFEAQGESGTPNFTPGRDGLASWIDASREIALKSQERKTVPFSITIPANADPGGYFAAIFLGTTPPDTSGGVKVSIGGRVGLLILLKVSGPIKEAGGIIEFNLQDKKQIYTGLPLNFYYRFRDDGADRVKPAGQIIVKNMLGMQTVQLDANPSQGNVLPSSVRRFEIPWGTPLKESDSRSFGAALARQMQSWHFGYYTATLHLTYGDTVVQNISREIHFWIVPWQLLSVIVAILLFVLWFFTFGIKRYNRWIISRARVGRNR